MTDCLNSIMANEVASQGEKIFSEELYESLITVSPFPSILIKLDNENYLIWKSHILPILRGHKLDKFVLCDEPIFLQTFVDSDTEVTEENLILYSFKQQIWILQDQFLDGWLIFAIIVSELGDIVGLRTSRRIWITIT